MCDNRQWDAYLQNFRTEVTSSDLALYSENERDVYRDVYIVNGYAMVIVWITKWACSNHNNMYNITQLFTHQMSQFLTKNAVFVVFFSRLLRPFFLIGGTFEKGHFGNSFCVTLCITPPPPPPHQRKAGCERYYFKSQMKSCIIQTFNSFSI